MKTNTRTEESFIFAIHNKRHKVNEIALALPAIIGIFFAIIGAPILGVLLDLSAWWIIGLIIGPLAVVVLFYTIRKEVIRSNFVKVKDVSDLTEVAEIAPSELEAMTGSEIFMFAYSEYMKVVLYNWFCSLHAVGDGKLKMYKVVYGNPVRAYLAIREADLTIPAEALENYKSETFTSIRLSDMEDGRVVNQKLYARLNP